MQYHLDQDSNLLDGNQDQFASGAVDLYDRISSVSERQSNVSAIVCVYVLGFSFGFGLVGVGVGVFIAAKSVGIWRNIAPRIGVVLV
jgi:hypothetical protein